MSDYFYKERSDQRLTQKELRFAWTVDVAGTRYGDWKEVYLQLYNWDEVVLVREPHNEYDSMAIRVDTLAGKKLGYIPREENEILARYMDVGGNVAARIEAIYVGDTLPLRIQLFAGLDFVTPGSKGLYRFEDEFVEIKCIDGRSLVGTVMLVIEDIPPHYESLILNLGEGKSEIAIFENEILSIEILVKIDQSLSTEDGIQIVYELARLCSLFSDKYIFHEQFVSHMNDYVCIYGEYLQRDWACLYRGLTPLADSCCNIQLGGKLDKDCLWDMVIWFQKTYVRAWQ